MKIIKRDGRKVDFSKDRIINAIVSASTPERKDKILELAKRIANEVEKMEEEELSVEQIQDYIEKRLMNSNQKDTAKRFIIYRNDRTRYREAQNKFFKEISNKISAKNLERQNANVDEMSFGGRNGAVNSFVLKKYALENCMSEMSRNNHLNNEIYIHDLDSYACGQHNCLSIPFDQLLRDGFTTRQTDIRPANSISTAFQLLAVIFQVQSLQQFGGVSATHLDWTMVPYIRKSFSKHFRDGIKYLLKEEVPANFPKELSFSDKNYNEKLYPSVYSYAMDLTVRETKQAVEGMFHNLNTLQSRSGNQLPFTSINYGTCTLPEGRLIIKTILEEGINGVGKYHRTSIFPCSIFKCKKGINMNVGEQNYDLFRLALKSTSLRLYPNYANVDWSGNEGYDPNNPATEFSTMGCRTANGYDINGLGQLKDGRGNICPVTIILPTLAMQAKGDVYNKDIDSFFEILDKKIDEAKDMLLERFFWICSQPMESARFMYENHLMAGYNPEEGIISGLKHGTLAVGSLGWAECLQVLIGENQLSEKGLELAKRIGQLFKEKCQDFKNQYRLNFGVYYTPAENLCYTSMKKFKEQYGTLKNISDREFFTNSMHIPVWEKIDLFKKIDVESQLTGYSSAGCITYVEMDSALSKNVDALEEVVKYAMNKDIPYFAINVPCDFCCACGYEGEIVDKCPSCGSSNIQRLRRVTGYLTGDYKTAFNKGKQCEVEERVRHTSLEVC